MTADEWLRCNDVAKMLDALSRRASERQLRLFAAAFCRQVWDMLVEGGQQEKVEAAERFADGETIPDPTLMADIASQAVYGALTFRREWTHNGQKRSGSYRVERWSMSSTWTEGPTPWDENPVAVAQYVAGLTLDAAVALSSLKTATRVRQARLQTNAVRCIFGPLRFRRRDFDPTLRTSTVMALAGSMYASRDFSPAPVLADALLDAGCDDALLMGHLRGESRHWRGCWVIDAILGLEEP